MKNSSFKTWLRRALISLPLLGILIASILYQSAKTSQYLVLIVLVWFQVFLMSETFA